MKVEVPAQRPAHYEGTWPGEWDLFHHYEFVAGVPSTIFVITTLKENGKANACLHSWSSFVNDGPEGFYAVMPGLLRNTHTNANIQREKEFCVNFLPAKYYDALMTTIRENGDDVDELQAAGLTAEPARVVKPPRIAEAFISYECTLHSHQTFTEKGAGVMVVGKVVHAAVEDSLRTAEGICSPDTFMMNIHSPLDPSTGKRTTPDRVAHLRLNQE